MITIEVIPYKNFKEKIKIVKQQLDKSKYVEVTGKYIYTEKKNIDIDGYRVGM
ncbi:hypothetical protein [Senegalia massiliensis]|uniref:hypothetical protein n=1 Tax=Senegalia massiliensis TaxID=1720316 RepID=UPI0013EF2520|nr:hypothetical protein [Senegalia massiliensis]